MPLQEPPGSAYTYCKLLNIPTKPYPASTPKPYLGIYFDSKKIESSFTSCEDSYFIRVAGVIDSTPAAKAGIHEDDIILALNDSPVCNTVDKLLPSFKKLIEIQKIGSKSIIDILRGDERLLVDLILEEMPTHIQHEADHPEISQCPDQRSLLLAALQENNNIYVYEAVIDDLYHKTNVLHNPGSAAEKHLHPLQLNEVTYIMRNPISSGELSRGLSYVITDPVNSGNWNLRDLLLNSASMIDIKLTLPPQPSEATLDSLLLAIVETRKNLEEALSSLTSEEIILIQKRALAPWDYAEWNTVLDISLKFDRTKLFNAFSPLLSFFTKEKLSLLKHDMVARFKDISTPILFEEITPMGKVIIGGDGPNIYTEDAFLILDIGGDDLYLNNAGGTRPGMSISLVIDWGGSNRYISKENFSQGSGVLGGGFLIDLGENATFSALDASQGAGFWGIGLLYHGNGTATYNSRSFSQGTGQMGIGLIINRDGNSSYTCSYGCQGFGLFGGAGISIDRSGNDFYQLGGLKPDFRDPTRSTVSFGQGFAKGFRPEKNIKAVPGGIGMLIDQSGNDIYIADYFSQGASYYYGLGILNDMSGDDQYISGRYSQGAGIHSSVGVLIDRKGDDFYYSSFGVGQGLGHDFGVGFLEDDEGNDIYRGGILVQGAATNRSIGIFLDNGGNDQLTFTAKGQAYADEEKSLGIMIERGQGISSEIVKIGIMKEK